MKQAEYYNKPMKKYPESVNKAIVGIASASLVLATSGIATNRKAYESHAANHPSSEDGLLHLVESNPNIAAQNYATSMARIILKDYKNAVPSQRSMYQINTEDARTTVVIVHKDAANANANPKGFDLYAHMRSDGKGTPDPNTSSLVAVNSLDSGQSFTLSKVDDKSKSSEPYWHALTQGEHTSGSAVEVQFSSNVDAENATLGRYGMQRLAIEHGFLRFTADVNLLDTIAVEAAHTAEIL